MAVNDDTCAHPVVRAINDKLEKDQEDGRRNHLGASLIGRKCRRELWYSFRWATDTKHKGRMLRLFNRGHREEDRFVDWLRQVGVEHYPFAPHDYVLAYHPESECYIKMSVQEWHNRPMTGLDQLDDVTGMVPHEHAARLRGIEIPEPKQIRIRDVDGHFGGSGDGVGRYFPEVHQLLGLPYDEWGLTEFKTHGQKSFEKLLAEKVRSAKPEHWAQMQTYMHKLNLKFALYMAICKNTDRLYCEYVLAEPLAGQTFINKAVEIVHSTVPPKKIGQTEAWFECKFCDHIGTCHRGEAMAKSCRTCTHVAPVQDGRWYCGKWGQLVPKEAERAGCANWVEIKE